uniref:Uncharacterized protein n=1 Tax=Arundo donax TaxID=35708 RepID=A0A0A8Y450_ARUDO
MILWIFDHGNESMTRTWFYLPEIVIRS